MIYLKPQTTLSAFAIVTLLAAGTVFGSLMGVGFGEALYLVALFLIRIRWLFHRFRLQQAG